MPVKNHNYMLSKQFLLSTHGNQANINMVPPRLMKKTLTSKFATDLTSPHRASVSHVGASFAVWWDSLEMTLSGCHSESERTSLSEEPSEHVDVASCSRW